MSRQPWNVNTADWVLQQGWGVGTRLVGDEGFGPTTIEITAIGRQKVLAVHVDDGWESSWTFAARDWEVAS